MATKTEPDTSNTHTGLAPNGVDEKGLYLEGMASSDANSDALAIVARIMSATDGDDIFGGPGTLLSSEDMIGKPFTLTDVEYRESDIEGDGPGVYALLHVMPWGETASTLVTCGARNVMAAAFRGKQLNLLPRGPMTLVEGKQTRKGFKPLWLQDIQPNEADNLRNITNASAKDDAAKEEPFS